MKITRSVLVLTALCGPILPVSLSWAQPQTGAKEQTNILDPGPRVQLSRDEAARAFVTILNEAIAPTVPVSEEQSNRVLSAISLESQKLLTAPDQTLLVDIASQWAGDEVPIPLVTVESEGDKRATVRVERPVTPPRSLVLVEENGYWGVDVVATYALWNDLPPDATFAQAEKHAQTRPEYQEYVRARGNAHRAACQSNLKQIALGVLQYVQDHDGELPPAKTWIDAIFPYVKNEQIFNCVSVEPGQKYGYAFNSRLSVQNQIVLKQPHLTAMVYETTELKRNAFGDGENTAFRHLEGANYAFADGHVKWVTKTSPQPSFLLDPQE